jgi:hypothetical protein
MEYSAQFVPSVDARFALKSNRLFSLFFNRTQHYYCCLRTTGTTAAADTSFSLMPGTLCTFGHTSCRQRVKAAAA